MLHRCIEGEKVDVDDQRGDDFPPNGTPAPPGERGREPPPPSSSLPPPIDGGRVSPLVHGLHGGGGARAPLRLDLSFCYLLFRVPVFQPFTVS